MATEAPVGVSIAPTFSSSALNLDQGYVTFTNEVHERVTISTICLSCHLQFTSLPGKGSYPSSSCSREDCDFYFRWGVNPNNPNYLTFFISADLSRGWAAIGVSRDRRMVSNILY